MGVAGELHEVARRIVELPAELGENAAAIYEAELTSALVDDTGGDRILSGMRGAGERLVVDVTTDEAGAHVDIAAGPLDMRRAWRWLNDGTRARQQGSGRHPGTSARHTFDAPIAAATGRVLEGIDRDFTEALT